MGAFSGQAAGRAGQQAQAGHDRVLLRRPQERQGLPNPFRVEQRPEPPEPDAGVGEPDLDSAGIRVVPAPSDQPEPGELGELQRSGGAGDPESRGEVTHRGGCLGIEVLKDAGLVIRHTLAAGRIAELATPAGRMDGGISREDRVDGIIEHWSNLVAIL
jgi:hypothetical protein